MTRARLEALSRALHEVQASCNIEQRLAADPVALVRRHRNPSDQELAGLLAASLAFGQVQALRAAIEQAQARLGSPWPQVLDQRSLALQRLRGFQYRMIHGQDIARLLAGARAVQRRHGTLGAAFARGLRRHDGMLRPALTDWTAEVREAARLDSKRNGVRRGPRHILPDPSHGSGCKRLLLYLRWMVRPDDGVDLGLWGEVSPRVLLMPVDTHVHRLATNLGLTRRRNASWLAAEEITSVLRRIDPDDPVRFDFALCHLGMVRQCRSVADERCKACGVREVCMKWGAGR